MNKFSQFHLAGALAILGLVSGCEMPKTKPTDSGPGIGYPNSPDSILRGKPANILYAELEQHTFSDAGQDFDPFLDNNGKNLVYASTQMSPRSDIFLKQVNSRVVEQITHTPNSNEKQPQISPDGKSIIFASEKEGQWNIYEISATDRGSRELEVVRNGRINEQPSYSPDGSRITYATWMPKKAEWWIAITHRQTQQEKLYGPGIFPKFSPDGKKILFQQARVHSPQWYSIWILDLEHESISNIISNDKWAAITPSWSPDGKRVIFASVNKSLHANGPWVGDDIYTIWANGTHLMRLTSDDSPDWNPVWSNNGRVYFISLRNNQQNIWSIKPRDMDAFHPDTVESVAPGALSDLDTL